jgi:hypothetical protein
MAGVHSSESLQFLQLSSYILLDLTNKSNVNFLLVVSGFQVKGSVQAEGLTNAHKTGWDAHLTLGGPLMFFLYSWPSSFLPHAP